jgi:tetratricopeptide (TPR) repeat protein
MPELVVELMDEYSRPLQRARTNGSGRYAFTGLSYGRFKIRVSPFGTDYEEQEREVEIVNFSAAGSAGGRVSGSSSEQLDFTLRFRKGVDPATAGVIFAQSVPDGARKLYDQAIADLNNKKDAEGLAGLKAALEAFPTYYAALDRLGSEYARLGHYDAAKILLTMAVNENPRGAKTWYTLAYANYSLKSYEEAMKAVDKVLAINSSSAEALLLSGVLYRQSKKFEESEKRLFKARDISKDTLPQVHWELALLYGNNMNRYADAAKELKLFLKSQPDAKDSENIKKLIVKFEEKAAGS